MRPNYQALYKLLLTLSLYCCVQCCTAQPANYLFHHLGPKNGLIQENTYSVCQDKRGFLWMSFRNGVQRYDGHRFQNFFTGKGILPAGLITSMSMDPQGRLWIITNYNEVGYVNTDKFTYHAVKVNLPASFANTGAGMNFGDGSNIMLIYVGHGFLTFNESANEFALKYNQFSLPAGFEPKHLVFDADKNYWISTNSGFVKYSTKKKLLSYPGHNAENDPFITAFGFVKNCGVIYTDNLKRIWITYTQPGMSIRSFDPATGETKAWETVLNTALKGTAYSFWGINHFSDGSLWINGPGLLARVNYEQNSIEPVVTDPSSDYAIRYDVAGSLFEDREKSIWVCTNRGLYRFNPSAHIFQTINNRATGSDKTYPHSVTGLLETPDGELLVSTWGEGVFSYDNNLKPIASNYLQRKRNNEAMVWCLLQTKNGDIWRGGQQGMLYIYEAASKKTIVLSPELCNGRTIRQLAEDKDGNIWLGTQGGRLIKWTAADKQFRLQQVFKGVITRLYKDYNNNIWACTDYDGVYHIKNSDGSILNHYTSNGNGNKKLLINGASDILQYDDTTIVIASNGLNILNTKTGVFKYWDEGAEIGSMVLDRKRRLWLSTSVGVVCRKPENQEIHYSFDENDGIGNFSFSNSAGLLLKNGMIAFGSNHEFIVFDPEKAVNFSIGWMDVQVSGIIIGDKRLPVDSVLQLPVLKLPFDQNSLIIRFTHNQYQTLQNIHYKVEGLDKEWKRVRADGEVNLTYIPPGRYTIQATTLDEKMQPTRIISIPISVAAPFYKQWWFYSAIVLVCVVLLLWFYNARIKRKEAMQKMRSSIASKLHEEVNVTLNNINVLSEMAKLKADTEPQKSKEFIEQINRKSQGMIDSMDDMLWSISPENDSMEKTIQRMQEFIDAQVNRYAIKVVLTVDERVKQMNLPMQLRHEAFLLFKSGLLGLLQAGAENIGIQVAKDKNHLLYLMKCDTGKSNTSQLSNLFQDRQLIQKMETLGAKWDVHVYKSHALVECRVPLMQG